MIIRYYQKSSIGAFAPLRLRGGRAPFVANATFPPIHWGNYPKRGKLLISLNLNNQLIGEFSLFPRLDKRGKTQKGEMRSAVGAGGASE